MATISRKDFLKKACISGVCMCGFSSIALFANNTKTEQTSTEPDNSKLLLVQEWTSNLLSNLNEQFSGERLRPIVKNCAIVHYNHLKMDEMLAPYVGNLEQFIDFIENKWGWKVSYDKTNKTLIADESKSYCVCPIINHDRKSNPSNICYCSEGFAERMFSKVAGVPVKATVISSIIRGDDRCRYKIVFS
ncbi:MAG: DUF6144 family protein [Bacteroidota bacterium]|nr:DUF6144 family protein [Bacteroidota bacterium]